MSPWIPRLFSDTPTWLYQSFFICFLVFLFTLYLLVLCGRLSRHWLYQLWAHVKIALRIVRRIVFAFMRVCLSRGCNVVQQVGGVDRNFRPGVRQSVAFNRWRTVVSATWKYDDPRLNMSHEGAARVWHVQPRGERGCVRPLRHSYGYATATSAMCRLIAAGKTQPATSIQPALQFESR